jgi:hypothetical protein
MRIRDEEERMQKETLVPGDGDEESANRSKSETVAACARRSEPFVWIYRDGLWPMKEQTCNV